MTTIVLKATTADKLKALIDDLGATSIDFIVKVAPGDFLVVYTAP